MELLLREMGELRRNDLLQTIGTAKRVQGYHGLQSRDNFSFRQIELISDN
jgi:hypothetical protein